MAFRPAAVSKKVGNAIVRVTLTDVIGESNFRNNSPVLTFTVNMIVEGLKIIELPGVKLIDGRIQLPEIRRRISAGEIRQKVVKPIYALLQLVWEAVEASDWAERYPNFPALIPIVRRSDDPAEELQDDDEADEQSRYIDPRGRK